MTGPSITLRPATGEDLGRVEALLDANDLPSRDVRTSPGWFFLADAGPDVVGVGGVEGYGSNGLLRSVVVAESSRGQGYGRELCRALERRARKRGIETLYLLTTTASAFFRGEGYAAIARADVPTSVRQTTEFADYCPTSAICMEKSLRSG